MQCIGPKGEGGGGVYSEFFSTVKFGPEYTPTPLCTTFKMGVGCLLQIQIKIWSSPCTTSCTHVAYARMHTATAQSNVCGVGVYIVTSHPLQDFGSEWGGGWHLLYGGLILRILRYMCYGPIRLSGRTTSKYCRKI